MKPRKIVSNVRAAILFWLVAMIPAVGGVADGLWSGKVSAWIVLIVTALVMVVAVLELRPRP